MTDVEFSKEDLRESSERFISKMITGFPFSCMSAMQFSLEAHKDQKRKYTNAPYFTHLSEVVGLVSSVHKDHSVLATAWLHDCVEDCGVAICTINEKFGEYVAAGVFLLSDIETGNRKQRKELSRIRLESAPDWVQDIKVCDLISNTSSIVQHDPKFAKVYLEEKKLMLDVLTKADNRLIEIARNFL